VMVSSGFRGEASVLADIVLESRPVVGDEGGPLALKALDSETSTN
jgi:hypothetical protein